tara:strand:+ start:495 stop:698 length:204 start_codon:yes stop_codon:yes gene_type:complete
MPNNKKVSAVGIGKSIYDDYKEGTKMITNDLTRTVKNMMKKKKKEKSPYNKSSKYYADGGIVMTGRD